MSILYAYLVRYSRVGQGAQVYDPAPMAKYLQLNHIIKSSNGFHIGIYSLIHRKY